MNLNLLTCTILATIVLLFVVSGSSEAAADRATNDRGPDRGKEQQDHTDREQMAAVVVSNFVNN